MNGFEFHKYKGTNKNPASDEAKSDCEMAELSPTMQIKRDFHEMIA